MGLAVLAFALGWWTTRGPAGGERPAGRTGGVWLENLDEPPQTLDPGRVESAADVRVASLIYEGLVRLGPDGRLEPALARRWEVTGGGRRYVFWLKPGVRFHNGRPLTAEDVVYSLARLLDPRDPAPRAWVLEGVEGAHAYRQGRRASVTGLRAVGRHRVEIRLDAPRPAFLQRLATPGAYVIDRETAEQGGRFAPVGTGPFRLVAWSPAEVRLAAYAGYHRGRPYLDEVRLLVEGPRTAVLAAFARGQRAALRVVPHELRDLAVQWGWSGPQWRVEPPATAWIEVNGNARPLDRAGVRRALAYAVDRETLIAGLLPGGYRLADGLIPPGMAGSGQARSLPAYRADAARRHLVDAGVRPGTTLRWLQPGDPLWAAVAGRLDYLLGRVGLELVATTVDHAEFRRRVAGSPPTVHLTPRTWWAEYPDPEAVLLPWAARRGWISTGTGSLGTLTGAQGPQRARAAARLEQALLQQGRVLPLYHPVWFWAVQPWVRGFRPTPFPQGPDLWAVSLDVVSTSDGG